MEARSGHRNKPQDKKALILIAAADLIRDHGVQAISFERIAKQAGLSRQLLRYYFNVLIFTQN